MTTRRDFARLSAAAAGAALFSTVAFPDPLPAAEEGKLQSELLFDLVFERGPSSAVGAGGARLTVVSVSDGTFGGPKLKGSVASPSGDWIAGRPDGSGVVDLRMLLQTDDAQKILMRARGIAYSPKGGGLYARILPMFETSATKYAWINDIVAVGVYRPIAEKIGYRVYQIL